MPDTGSRHRTRQPGLVLDLSEVRVMSSSTLSVIVRARVPPAAVSVVDGPVPHDPVRRLIDACGLDDLIGPDPKATDGGVGERWPFGPVGPSRCPTTRPTYVGQGAR